MDLNRFYFQETAFIFRSGINLAIILDANPIPVYKALNKVIYLI